MHCHIFHFLEFLKEKRGRPPIRDAFFLPLAVHLWLVASMASGTKRLLACFLILFLFLNVVAEASFDNSMKLLDVKEDVGASDKILRRPKINCQFACSRRCSKASRMNVCMRACSTCCFKCNCVPAGTYGNKNMCPCYAKLRTHGRKPKCP